jgi:hypothetical protein
MMDKKNRFYILGAIIILIIVVVGGYKLLKHFNFVEQYQTKKKKIKTKDFIIYF